MFHLQATPKNNGVCVYRTPALRFRSTTFRKRGRVATVKVTFSKKSAPRCGVNTKPRFVNFLRRFQTDPQ